MLIAHLPPPGLEGMYDHSPRKPTFLWKKRRFPKDTQYTIFHYFYEFYGTCNLRKLKNIDLARDCLEVYPPPPSLNSLKVKRTGLYVCTRIAFIGVFISIIGFFTYIVGKATYPFENNGIMEVTDILFEEGLFEPLDVLRRRYDDPFIKCKMYGVFMLFLGFLILICAMILPTIATAFRFRSLEGFTSENCTPIGTPVIAQPMPVNIRIPYPRLEITRVQPKRNRSPRIYNYMDMA